MSSIYLRLFQDKNLRGFFKDICYNGVRPAYGNLLTFFTNCVTARCWIKSRARFFWAEYLEAAGVIGACCNQYSQGAVVSFLSDLP